MTVAAPERTTVPATRLQFFAAPADDPRARRAIDVAILIGSVLVMFLLAWSHRAPSDVDTRVFEFFDDGVPGWISGIATIVFLLGGVYAFALIIGIGLFGHGRRAIARDILLAVALVIAATVAMAYVAGPEFPDVLPELIGYDGSPSYPVLRLGMTVAAIRVAGPYLTVPMRTVGRRLLVAVTISSVVMGYGTLSATIGGLALGTGAAATIHLIFGSGLGIPSRERIERGLREIGLEIAELRFVPDQPIGASIVRVDLASGEPLLVKVYGRDAADAATAARAWRSVWYRTGGDEMRASNVQLAEHESLMMLACERDGVPAPRLLGWSRASTDDLLLVARWVDGERLSHLAAEQIDDAILDRVWGALTAFHSAGIAHRGIERDRIVVTDDGALLTDVSDATILASDEERATDVAQLVVATAVAVGSERAIAAARRHLDDDVLFDALPVLQSAALPRELQRDAKNADLKFDELRNDIADALEVDEPEVVQLQRVTWGNVAMIALTAFAAYSLLTTLTGIGFDTIAEQLSNATWGWVVVALIMAQLTNVGEYYALVGVMGRPAPFGPTLLFRYALSFISLAVPSEAGAIAMNIRYQQKLGVPASAAIAQGPLLTIVSKGFDVILLLITARIVGQAIDLDEIDTGPIVDLVIIIVVLVVVGVVVVLSVPSLRERFVPHVREGFSAVKGSLTDPQRLSKIVAGTLAQKILFAMTLAASVAAYGSSIRFGEAVFVNSAVSLFVGLMPVPGGIGVGEAALTAGLIAVGVPEEAAFAAALTHRIVTAYLPPVFGWWASRWLTQRDYL